jgi:hypothetical protein
MTVKVLLSWDVAQEREQEYFEFVIREFIPGVQRLGLEPTEAWATIYGQHPQVMVAMTAADLPKAQRILASGEWYALHDQLAGYIKNYSDKIVPAKGGFQF